MNKRTFTILSQREIASGTHELVLGGDTSGIGGPGQFVDLSLEGFFLRRPFAMADVRPDSFTLLYKEVGRGTARMASLPEGTVLDVLGGLGRGFDPDYASGTALIVAGGLGVAPLHYLAKELSARGRKVVSILGFGTAAEVCYHKEFGLLGEVRVATMDGTMGTHGTVMDALDGVDFDCFYACGPLVMERAICQSSDKPGQVSMEARMGCGTGICMGCTIITKNGPRRVCKDGPVFDKEDIIW